jgi:hypothetical protein
MASTSDASLSPRRRRGWYKWLWILLIGGLLLISLYTWFMLSWSYSEGERAGVLQKFSRRGWVCKTNEGELALYVVGGVAPQIWHFSVRDPEVAAQLHKAVGSQVRLHYTEHPGLPTTCFGETPHFVDHLEIVEAPGALAPGSGLTIAPRDASPAAPEPTPP